ncbi:KN motif and ankyrin repeat domain-containing protein 2 isoform X3 [Dermacentor albipictus]|uniref:KN motif and ankyrin repeat domain-containing protein 2 isoform X3 n=1 Tax=Dermacentor albipictus TaxID=60249 RepID=UPI0031FC56F6
MYAPTQSELRERLESLRSSSSTPTDWEHRTPPRNTSRSQRPRRSKVKMGYHTWTPGMLHDQLMAELKTREGSRCNCCPYGYHIHLDFVQFCDSLKAQAARSNMDQIRQQCRERRRQRKSLQSYLGMLDNEVAKQDAIIAAPPKILELRSKALPSAPPPDLLASNDDTLNEVFRNFEDVLSSHERGLGNGHIDDGREIESELQKVDLLRNAPKYADSAVVSPEPMRSSVLPSHWREADQRKASEILDMAFGPARSRSGSASSISSLSTNSSTAVPDFPGLRAALTAPRPHHVGISRTAVGHREQAATSPSGGGGGNSPSVNRAALANVRELMATSLGRIRHLEDEVKAIPFLQEKLSLLEEEKRLLMLQLKTKSNQLGQRSVGVGDNHILGPTKRDAAGDALDEYIRKLENQSLAAFPKTSRSDAKVQASVPTTSTHSMTVSTKEDEPSSESLPLRPSRSLDRAKPAAVRVQKTIGVGCCVLTRSIAVGDSGELLLNSPVQASEHEGSQEKLSTREVDADWKLIPRAKLHVCKQCTERVKKQFESKETATDPEAGKDVRKKLEQLTFDVCEPTSVKPEPRPCLHCEERSKRVFGHSSTNTEAVLTSDVGVSVLTLQPFEIPPPESPQRPRRSRSQGAQTQRVLRGNVGVQFSPVPLRKRDVMLQADVTERRHVGLQVTTVEAKPLTVSTGTGITDVRRVICDRCANLRQRSVAVGNHVSRRDMAVSISLQAETVSQGCGDCAITDALCEKCRLKQTETIGVGDFDVNCVVCDACMEKSTSEEKPPSTQSVGTVMTSSVEEPGSLDSSSGVRLCDKCNCQITSVAKDFIDKNVLDPVLPTLSSRIPKLSGRSLRKPTAPRASSVPPSSENRNVLLGSLGDPKVAAISQQQLREPPARMTERAEKHEPSKEVKAACKVLNDYLMKPERGDPNKLKTAVSLIQQEWFQISSPADADANMLEDYMDTFEEFSRHLLHRIVNMADVNGNTAIHYAVSHGNFDAVSILLDSKVCDVSKQNKAGYTCIMLVSLAEIKNDTHRLVVQRLFQLGDVNAKAMQNGQTALMLAASHGRLEMIKLLLDAGAEPNVQDNDGSTALMCAAEHGYIEIVRVLLAHPDTEVCLADNDGSTALTIAMEAGHKDTALLIYANSNFSRGSSPYSVFHYSSLRMRKRPSPRSTPPPSRPSRTPPPPSPARSRRTSTSTVN